jgi:uncharacterized protein YceK
MRNGLLYDCGDDSENQKLTKGRSVMKILLLAFFSLGLLSGCASIGGKHTKNSGGSIDYRSGETAVRVIQGDNPRSGAIIQVDSSGTVKVSTGSTFENKLGSIREQFRSLRPYHFAAIACAIIGAIILGTPYLPNRAGVALIAAAAALGLFAHMLPQLSTVFLSSLIVASVLGAAYWLYEKGHFTPTPKGQNAST